MKPAFRCGRVPRIAAATVAATALFTAAAYSPAAEFPSKPVRLLVPFAPGGGADLNARRFAEQLQALWKQSIVVQNQGGAGGNVAAAATVASEPDGYTLLFASLSGMANNLTLYQGRLAFDMDRDLAAVVLVGEVPLVLMVGATSPAKDVASLIALARQRPKTMHFGSGGVGTSMHLTGELFKAVAGIDIVHVPFKGAGPVAAAIMGGEIQMIFQNAGLAESQIKSGRLKVLAVAGRKRLSILSELPTFTESGVPDFHAAITYGIYVQGTTPAPLIGRLNRDINTVLNDPKYKAQMARLGVEVLGGTTRELVDYVAAERKKWVPIIRKLGIKSN